MSAVVLSRLRELFLAPAAPCAEAPAVRVAERAVPATLGVLAAPADAAVAGTALGLAAAGARRTGGAIVCRWSAPGAAGAAPVSGPASGAARRAAARLAARGLAVAARGRLVTVALPDAAGEARAAAERALAAAGELPVVVVVAGPRAPALDPLLAGLDRLVVVPPSDAAPGLEDLALDAAARLGRSTALLRVPRGGTAAGRLLATGGVALLPAWRRAAAASLGGEHE